MLTSAKNEAVKFRDEREIYRCTRKRQGCTRKRHASGRGSPPNQPSQLLRLHSLRSADIHNTPSNLCGGERRHIEWNFCAFSRQICADQRRRRLVRKCGIGSGNRLHWTFYPSRVLFSGTRTHFTRARTTFSVGPSTGKSLVQHG